MRRLAVAMQLLLLLPVLLDLTLVSGVVERRLVPALSKALLQAEVHLWFDGWRPLRLRAFSVRDTTAASQLPPLVSIGSASLDYRFPSDGDRRPFSDLHLQDVRLQVRHGKPDSINYRFLVPLLSGGHESKDKTGPKGDPGFLLPERVRMDNIDAFWEMEEGSGALTGLNGDLRIDSFEDFSLLLYGEAVGASWDDISNLADVDISSGQASVAVSREGNTLALETAVRLPDFMTVEGTASVSLSPKLTASASIAEAWLSGSTFSGLLAPFLPLPVAFDAIAAAPFTLSASFAAWPPSASDVHIRARIEGLQVGDPSTPWYQGDVSLQAEGSIGDQSNAMLAVTLNQGQEIQGSLERSSEALELRATFEDWTASQVFALWPAPLASWRRYFPEINRLGGDLHGSLADRTLRFEGALSPILTQAPSPRVSFSGNYDLAGVGVLRGECTLGDGQFALDVNLDEDGTVQSTLSIIEAEAADLLRMIFPEGPHADLRMRVNGRASVENAGADGFQYALDAHSVTPSYGNWTLTEALSPLLLEMQGTASSDFSGIEATALHLALGEAATLTLAPLHYAIREGNVKAKVEGAAELVPLGAFLGLDDLWGEVAWNGAFTLNQWRQLEFPSLQLTLDPFGYDQYSIPYGEALHIQLPLLLALDEGSAAIGPMEARLGEETVLTASAATFSREDGAYIETISLESSFAPLVAKRYLSSATGAVKAVFQEVRWNNDGLTGSMSYSCAAPRLLLPDKLADIQGLSLEGGILFQPSLGGEGLCEIDSLLAAGLTFSGLKGTVRGVDRQLRIEDIRFDLFGGGVDASAAIEILEPGFPITISGEARNIDLSVFTTEFEPPSLVLTGRVNGAFAAGFTLNQLTMLDVDLKAHEGFSMNRDMVEQLLLSQYMEDIAGGKRMGKMVQNVIGTQAQRAFDSAALKLGFEDGRIVGYAKLESGSLNLTVDIKADPPAIMEALRIRQQQKVE